MPTQPNRYDAPQTLLRHLCEHEWQRVTGITWAYNTNIWHPLIICTQSKDISFFGKSVALDYDKNSPLYGLEAFKICLKQIDLAQWMHKYVNQSHESWKLRNLVIEKRLLISRKISRGYTTASLYKSAGADKSNPLGYCSGVEFIEPAGNDYPTRSILIRASEESPTDVEVSISPDFSDQIYTDLLPIGHW